MQRNTNIYNSNHPLIHIWVNHICYTKTTKNELIKLVYQTSLWLLFEMMRKYVNRTHLYIKYFNCINEIDLLTGKQAYTVISDIKLMQLITQDIYFFMPDCHIHPVYIYQIHQKWEINSHINLTPSRLIANQNIIIIEPYLEKERTILLINLIHKNIISISQINICCIICPTETLQFINKHYPKINIYTAKITHNYQKQNIYPFWNILYDNYIH